MRTILLLICILVTINLYSQENEKYENIKITYDVKAILADYSEKSLRVPMVKSTLDAVNDLNFLLIIKSDTSIFKLEERMQSDFNSSTQRAIVASGGKEKYYSDGEILLKNNDIFGENLNIEVNNNKYLWKITKHKEIILGFACYKAIGSYQSIDRNLNKVDLQVEAWFAPAISIPIGPFDLYGLPGLTLKVKRGKFLYNAIDIEINPKDLHILRPEANRLIKEEEYMKLIAEKIKEIKQKG